MEDPSSYTCIAKSVQIRSFFWSIFSCIRGEYGDLLRKSPYLVQMRENKGQKKKPYLHTFHKGDGWLIIEMYWPYEIFYSILF